MPAAYHFAPDHEDDAVGIVRTADGVFVPNPKGQEPNRDWLDYLKWRAGDGNTPDPAPAGDLEAVRAGEKGRLDQEGDTELLATLLGALKAGEDWEGVKSRVAGVEAARRRAHADVDAADTAAAARAVTARWPA